MLAGASPAVWLLVQLPCSLRKRSIVDSRLAPKAAVQAPVGRGLVLARVQARMPLPGAAAKAPLWCAVM